MQKKNHFSPSQPACLLLILPLPAVLKCIIMQHNDTNNFSVNVQNVWFSFQMCDVSCSALIYCRSDNEHTCRSMSCSIFNWQGSC